MAVRVTQQVVEVAYDTTPSARVTALAAEAVTLQNPSARVTAFAMEVIFPTAGATPPSSGGRKPVVFVIGG